MILQNYYYYFQNVLTPRFCDEIIKYGNSQQEKLALTQDVAENGKLSKTNIKDLKKNDSFHAESPKVMLRKETTIFLKFFSRY